LDCELVSGGVVFTGERRCLVVVANRSNIWGRVGTLGQAGITLLIGQDVELWVVYLILIVVNVLGVFVLHAAFGGGPPNCCCKPEPTPPLAPPRGRWWRELAKEAAGFAEPFKYPRKCA
jgi:hypothetical protein